MTFPIITAALAGVLLILQQVLMLSAGTRRARTGIGVGYADDKNLERLVRRHGNLAENSAIFIAGLALLELATGPTLAVQIFAGVFLLARLSHAFGFSNLKGSHGKLAGDGATGSGTVVLFRAGGATLTALTGIALGAYLLWVMVPQLPF
jgi:uncharacterized membrane protein YecN with MAPEG domain